MTTYPLILFLLLLPAPQGICSAAFQQEDPVVQLFSEGLSQFRAGNYSSAASAFGSAADAPGRNPWTTAACIMAAKSEYRAGRYDAARARAMVLLDRYPRSAYADEALYIILLSEFRLGRYDLAASNIVTLLQNHPRSGLVQRSRDLFGVIASSHLPLSELKRLTGTALPPGLHTAVAMALAHAYVRRSEDILALSVLDGLREHPDAAGSLP